MFRKIGIVVAAIFLTMQLLSACCNCEEFPVLRADWKGLALSHGFYTTDSGRVRSQPDTGLDFSNRRLFLYFTPKIEVLAARVNLAAFGNRAYACKCDDIRTYAMRRLITGITIRNLNSFDAQHPAGSDITSYFKGISPDGKELSAAPIALPDDLYPENWYATRFLDARPDAGGPQQFEVIMNLSDGAMLRDTTAVFRF